MEMKEKKIDGEVLYAGRVVRLERDRVLCPNGRESVREVVRHNGGAAILCLNAQEEVLLIRQFRYPYNEILLEIPAGKLEKNEDPYTAAVRELEEETGNRAAGLDYLGKIYPTCGYSSEIIYLYLAKDYVFTKTSFDEDECIEACFVPISRVQKMILSGEIKDAKTICALSYYLMRKS